MWRPALAKLSHRAKPRPTRSPRPTACSPLPAHAPCSPSQGVKHASPSYMSKQTDINAKMRAILIDWLVEVHLKFKLMPETLYLTVNLIDRFLEREADARNKLQLVGVTAMFIASKYEEIYAPECRDFVYISDKAYTRDADPAHGGPDALQAQLPADRAERASSSSSASPRSPASATTPRAHDRAARQLPRSS